MKLRSGAAERSAVPFPLTAGESLFALSRQDQSLVPKSVHLAADALRSFRDASAQRQQTAAMKVLVGILQKPHPSVAPCPLCSLVAPALHTLAIDSPDMSYTIASTALRAILKARCRADACRPPEVLFGPFNTLFLRLEARGNGAELETDSARRAADVRVVSTLFGDSDSRSWLREHPLRLCGAAMLALEELRDALDAGNGRYVFALGVLQDVCRAVSVSVRLQRLSSDAAEKAEGLDLGASFSEATAKMSELSWRVLCDPDGQRRDIMSAAVLLVSACACGAILREGGALSSDRGIAVVEESIVLPARGVAPDVEVFLLRAVVECPELASSCESLVRSFFLSRFHSLCVESSDVSLRFLCMESLVLSLRKLTPGTLSTQTRREVLDLVEARWEESYQGISCQMRETVDALLSVDGDSADEWWMRYAVSLLDRHTSSVGMYAPMSRIVARIGARKVLQQRPDAQESIMRAFKADVDAAKTIGDWLETFWRHLRQEFSFEAAAPDSFDSFARLCVSPIVSGLQGKQSRDMCRRVALYIVPAFLRACSGREQDAVRSLVMASREQSLTEDDTVRAFVVVLSAAQREKRCAAPDFADKTLFSQLQSALLHSEADIRLGALEIIAAGTSTSAPLSNQELQLIQSTLAQVLYPGSPAGEAHRIRGALGKFIARLVGSRSAALACSGWWDRERKKRHDGARTPEFEQSRQQYIKRLDLYLPEISGICLASCDAGSAPDRQIKSLELLGELASVAGVSCVLGAGGARSDAVAALLLRTSANNKWEFPRSIGLRLLSRISCEALGLHEDAQALSLLHRALIFLHSPRLYESESAATLCRLVFRKCVAVKRVRAVPLVYPVWTRTSALPDDEKREDYLAFTRKVAAVSADCAVLIFLQSILTRLHSRFDAACESLGAVARRGLFFGDVRVLRSCMLDTDWAALCAEAGPDVVRDFMKQVLRSLCDCGRLGLKGLDLNTNGFIDDSADASAILVEDESQKVGTSCYLSIKEVCLSLGDLSRLGTVSGCLSRVSEVSSSADRSGVNDSVVLLDVAEFERIGEFFQLIFASVRHNGVLHGATEGYEGVCRHLLLSSEKKLRALPLRWVAEALDAAMDGKMYVLRRSAGLSYSILGAVRAEGQICQQRRRTGSLVLGTVISNVLDVLFSNGFSNGKDLPLAPPGSNVEAEETIVHSLNVLRVLALDSVIAKAMTRYLTECMALSLHGFFATTWLVRNSSFMLFGALIRRAVGAPGERRARTSALLSDPALKCFGDDGRIAGVTPPQFFCRYPTLHSFLLSLLGRSSVDPDGSKGSVNELALYPTLYLLASFSPAADSELDNALTMRKFERPVDQFLGSRVDSVRRVAALAWVPLICNPSEVCAEVENAFNWRLPQSLVTGGQNRLHGELLRLAAILKLWCLGSIMSIEQKVAVSHVIATFLPRCCRIFLDFGKNPCQVTRAAMLKVMRRCVKLVVSSCAANASDVSAVFRTVVQVCMQALKTILAFWEDVRDVGNSGLIGGPAVLRGAAKLAAVVEQGQRALGLPLEDAAITCCALLKHPSSDVREMALKMCAAIGVSPGDEHDVCLAAVSLIQVETRPNVVEGALQAACAAVSTQSSKACDVLGDAARHDTRLWDRLLGLATDASCLGIQEKSLEMLGYYVVCIAAAERRALSEAKQVQWIALVESASMQVSVTTSRAAAARSIAASRALSFGDGTLTAFIRTRARLVIMRLLQDEDHNVRSFCLEVLARQLDRSIKGSCTAPDALPALFVLHRSLEANDSASLAYIESTLGARDILHGIFDVVHLKDAASQRPVTPDAVTDGEEKLFMDDTENMTDELDTRVQLAAWSLCEMARKEQHGDGHHAQRVAERLEGWTEEVAGKLTSQPSSQLGHDVFNVNPELFGQLNCALCRIAAFRSFVRGPMLQCASVLRKALADTDSRCRNIHPALLKSAEAVATSLETSVTSLDESAVFFLVCTKASVSSSGQCCV
jgi:Putative death-receptor fusion protein (DUF2428)